MVTKQIGISVMQKEKIFEYLADLQLEHSLIWQRGENKWQLAINVLRNIW